MGGATILEKNWAIEYVLLSILISFIGSITALMLTEQKRWTIELKQGSRIQPFVLSFISIAFGCCSLWMVHFVGMGALTLELPSNSEKIAIYHDGPITFASSAIVVIFARLGFGLANRDVYFSLINDTRIQMLKEKIRNVRLNVIKQNGSHRVLYYAMFHKTHYIILGGTLAGLGSFLMHCVGLLAIRGEVTLIWHAKLLVASGFVDVGLTCVSFWLMFRVLTWRPKKDVVRLITVSIMTGAASAMHYFGMAGVAFAFPESCESDRLCRQKCMLFCLDNTSAWFVAVALAALLCAIMGFSIIRDLRSQYKDVQSGFSREGCEAMQGHFEDEGSSSKESEEMDQRQHVPVRSFK